MRTLIASGVLASLVSVAAAGDALDRAQIQAGIAKVKAKIMACGNGAKVGGTIKIKATVNANGAVTVADATGDDAELGTCVATEIKKAVFAKTAAGGTFSYPFVFPKAEDGDLSSKRSKGGKSPGKPAMPPGDDPLGAPPQPSNELDRAAITSGIATVKTKVMACKGTGKVKVKVVVAPTGKVTSATSEAADAKLGACVAGVLKTATFSKTASGGSFTYPFVFGSATPPSTATPPSSPPPTPTAPPATGNDGLDRAAISDGIAKVKTKISGCAKGVKGKVKIKVAVAANGSVTSAIVEASPDANLGACVAGVLKAATFKATTQGGSFSYPFVF